MSSFSWLAFSEDERRRTLDVISLFSERETRDELGLGSVRDAFADLLFPGTSTLQTRARYFLFVPWTYQRVQASGSRREPAQRIRVEELSLIDALKQSPDPSGTIGIQAGQALKRPASSLYWQGLAVWGIRRFKGPQASLHRRLANPLLAVDDARDDDGEPLEPGVSGYWHADLPPRPDDFPEVASFKLTPPESTYMIDRLMTHRTSTGTMLAILADLESGSDVDFAWEHPRLGELPDHIRRQLHHARLFSLAMNGAALAYNIAVAELADRDETEEHHRATFADWVARVRGAHRELADWNTLELWSIALKGNPRIALATRLFVERWIAMVLKDRGDRLADDPAARRFLENREGAMKGGLARLHNARSREMWNGDSGSAPLDFRWPVVQRLINDLRHPLEEPSSA